MVNDVLAPALITISASSAVPNVLLLGGVYIAQDQILEVIFSIMTFYFCNIFKVLPVIRNLKEVTFGSELLLFSNDFSHH